MYLFNRRRGQGHFRENKGLIRKGQGKEKEHFRENIRLLGKSNRPLGEEMEVDSFCDFEYFFSDESDFPVCSQGEDLWQVCYFELF